MTRITQTKRMRKYFGEKDGRIYDALPLQEKLCSVCGKEMLVADGSVSFVHGCCRKFRNKKFNASSHIEKCHA